MTRRRELFCLAAILLGAILLRMAFVHEPFERDEGLYAYLGQVILGKPSEHPFRLNPVEVHRTDFNRQAWKRFRALARRRGAARARCGTGAR